jgi:hypothetical protein
MEVSSEGVSIATCDYRKVTNMECWYIRPKKMVEICRGCSLSKCDRSSITISNILHLTGIELGFMGFHRICDVPASKTNSLLWKSALLQMIYLLKCWFSIAMLVYQRVNVNTCKHVFFLTHLTQSTDLYWYLSRTKTLAIFHCFCSSSQIHVRSSFIPQKSPRSHSTPMLV